MTFEAVRFDPPARQAVPLGRMDAPGGEQATPCSRHQRNTAVGHCDRCGLFICALCRVESDGLTLCAPCFERLTEADELASMRMIFTDYARMAIFGALLGIVFFFVGAVIGPVVVYWAVRGLRQRRAMGEAEGRVSAVLSLLAGLLETAAGIWFLVVLLGT